ncbi:MAG: insulinase family protein [Deltaproteobacteria bacterium]|nr:insulinase family protein [Deltaproteobacteria bacterium]
MRRRLVAVWLLGVACASAPSAEPPTKPPPARAATSTASLVVPASESWRATAPAPGELKTGPAAARFTLENGLTVIVLPKSTMPVFQAAVVTRAGSAIEPKERAGLAYLAHAMLRDGSGIRDAGEFEQGLKDLGAEMMTYVDQDGGIVSVRGVARHAEQILELLSDAVARPELPKAALEFRVRAELAALARRRTDSFHAARSRLAMAIHGASSPLSRPVSGTTGSLALIKRKDVKEFYEREIVPEASALVIGGAVDVPQARAFAERFFARWIGSGESRPRKPAPAKAPSRSVTVVHRQNASQSLICLGRTLVPAGHADELPLEVAASILGGSFGSRLSTNLREGKGYTYGVNGAFETHAFGGEFVVCTSVKSEHTPKALEQIVAEISGMSSRPPGDDEVKVAARALAGASAAPWMTVGGAIESTARAFASRRPEAYSAQRARDLVAISPERVREAAASYFAPESWQFVLTGDARTLTAVVEKSGLPSPNVVMAQ